MRGATKWIVPIMGFRESSAQETGIERIWRGLRELSDHSVYVIAPYEWNERMRDLVDFIYRNSPTAPELMVIAYSWGCGEGFVTLARAAARVGLPIRVAVLCDPVWRSRLLPSWLPFNPLSVSRIFRPKIEIPASVERIEWVRQVQDIPMGHDLVAIDPDRTHISPGRYVMANHCRIDDSREFRALAEHWAQIFVHDLNPSEAGEPDALGLLERPMSRSEWMEFEPEEITAPACM